MAEAASSSSGNNTAIRELAEFRDLLTSKTTDTLDEERLVALLDASDKVAKRENISEAELKEIADVTWGLAFAIILNFPSSLNWTLALRLATSFTYLSDVPPGPQPLLGMEAIREATVAFATKPLIPKAFASFIIAMVAQHYITVDDLEAHALALLHFDWLKEELIFIEKSLIEITLMLADKLESEIEIQLMIDWIAETVRAMVADMDH
ncbi:hypothetical protein O3M35_003986 [Rhynocoris fuscipes]|uniref:Uncharacterized protein n=1 Tax=Rhynocoris fuscipes TaxID=488301 RepID=A0AAW1CI30_9HEMI